MLRIRARSGACGPPHQNRGRCSRKHQVRALRDGVVGEVGREEEQEGEWKELQWQDPEPDSLI